jgi:hypothetical protein
MKIEMVERVARAVAVLVGSVLLALIVVEPVGWWGLLGLAPLTMGLSGW